MSRHELDPRKDADILQALAGMGQPRVGERSDADLVGGAMAAMLDPRYAPVEPPPLPVPVAVDAPSRAPVVIAVATAALAIAAAVALVVLRPAGILGESAADSAGSLAPDVFDPDAEEYEAVPGQAKKAKKAKRQVAPEPSAIADDEADPDLPPNCQDVAPGVRVCSDGDTKVAAATATSGAGSVRLEQGRIRVISSPEGKPVIVLAGDVTITGRGTVFDATVKRSQGSEGDFVVVFVTSGAVTVTRAGQEPTRVGPGDPFVVGLGNDEAEEPEVEEPTKDPRPTRRKESPNDLLTRAQKLFGAGKTPQAVKLYETLVARHGSTAAGKAARVSLGRIELSRGRAKQALAHFDAYLAASAGSLVEEARYGRIRALRKLGRTGQELRSIEAFLADYSKSIYAARLNRRAAELRAK